MWLVPPSLAGASAKEYYVGLTRRGEASAAAASRTWSGSKCRARLAAALRPAHGRVRDGRELARAGVAYRSLSMPFYMENLLGQLGAIRQQGVFSLAHTADRPLATVATRDIAATAATLLADRWLDGRDNVPVFGPDRLSPNAMAEVMSDVLGQAVGFRQLSLGDVESTLVQRGASEGVARDMTEMIAAQNDGVYDADQAVAIPGPPTFAPGAGRCSGPHCAGTRNQTMR